MCACACAREGVRLGREIVRKQPECNSPLGPPAGGELNAFGWVRVCPIVATTMPLNPEIQHGHGGGVCLLLWQAEASRRTSAVLDDTAC